MSFRVAVMVFSFINECLSRLAGDAATVRGRSVGVLATL